MNELQILHRFHQGTGNFRIVAAIESWWSMDVAIKEALLKKWAAQDKEKKRD